MSVTVRTEVDQIEPDTWTAGTHWEVQDGNLWVIAADRTIAEYPAGRWLAVWRDQDDKPQDGVNRAGGEDDARDRAHVTVTCWATGNDLDAARRLAADIGWSLRKLGERT